jgi:peptide deformylase
MAIRTILKMGDPRLLEPASPVDIKLITSNLVQEVIDDLLHTMHAANGAGLAAPQIGVGQQIVVFGFDHNPRYPDAEPIPETILINPVISILSTLEEEDWEGCLSVPGIRAKVPRYTHIRYQGFDRQGQAIDRTAEDFHARVVQHECDHLFGKLFPMRVKDFRHFGFTDVLFPNLQDRSVVD